MTLKTEVLEIRVVKHVKNSLHLIARKRRSTVAQIAREALREYLVLTIQNGLSLERNAIRREKRRLKMLLNACHQVTTLMTPTPPTPPTPTTPKTP